VVRRVSFWSRAAKAMQVLVCLAISLWIACANRTTYVFFIHIFLKVLAILLRLHPIAPTRTQRRVIDLVLSLAIFQPKIGVDG
jgi:uncharacterized membrane protein YcjF (UPF0283 family)